MLTRYEQDAVATGETSILHLPWNHSKPWSKRGVIWCHENTATSMSWLFEPQFQQQRLVDQLGCPAISLDMGGPTNWGNTTARTRIGQAFTYLQSQAGVPSDKVILYAGSMGNIAAFNWAIENPTKVAAIVSVLSVIDLDYVHDNNVGGAAAAIEAAYGGAAAYEAALPTSNPVARAAQMPAVPIQMWYGGSDPYILQATANSFATTVGAERHMFGAAEGHNVFAVDYDQVMSFIDKYA
jgi:pimeloyl-ACP methyl ester carboxylesterase